MRVTHARAALESRLIICRNTRKRNFRYSEYSFSPIQWQWPMRITSQHTSPQEPPRPVPSSPPGSRRPVRPALARLGSRGAASTGTANTKRRRGHGTGLRGQGGTAGATPWRGPRSNRRASEGGKPYRNYGFTKDRQFALTCAATLGAPQRTRTYVAHTKLNEADYVGFLFNIPISKSHDRLLSFKLLPSRFGCRYIRVGTRSSSRAKRSIRLLRLGCGDAFALLDANTDD